MENIRRVRLDIARLSRFTQSSDFTGGHCNRSPALLRSRIPASEQVTAVIPVCERRSVDRQSFKSTRVWDTLRDTLAHTLDQKRHTLL